MKNTLFVVFLTGAVGAGIFGVVQWRKSAGQRETIAQLQTRAATQAEEITSLQAGAKELERAHEETIEVAARLAAQRVGPPATATNRVAEVPEADAAPVAGTSAASEEMGSLVSKMMQDPAMKKMIADQQRAMVGQLYSPLIKKLGLRPEEAEQFKKLLADGMAQGTEKALGLMGGAGATNRSEIMATLQQAQKEQEESVQTLLGEERYAEYKSYQQTVGERAVLNAWKLQASDMAPTEQQTEALLAIMGEEKGALPVPGAGLSQDPAAMEAMFSGDQASKLLDNQEELNRRVYDRARTVLSAEQLESFGSFQTNQLQMMRLGMSMARKMFTPEQGQGGK